MLIFVEKVSSDLVMHFADYFPKVGFSCGGQKFNVTIMD